MLLRVSLEEPKPLSHASTTMFRSLSSHAGTTADHDKPCLVDTSHIQYLSPAKGQASQPQGRARGRQEFAFKDKPAEILAQAMEERTRCRSSIERSLYAALAAHSPTGAGASLFACPTMGSAVWINPFPLACGWKSH